MKTLADFLVDITKDDELAKESLAKFNETDHSGLSQWFKEKGYDIDENECKKLVDNKDDFKSSDRVGIIY